MLAKTLVEQIRLALDLHLPLSKSRDAIAYLLYGRSYGAAVAAETAGVLPDPAPTRQRGADVTSRYRVDGDSIALAAARLLSSRRDSFIEGLGGHPPRRVVTSLRRLIAEVEADNVMSGRTWADWIDNDDILDRHGDEASLEYNESIDSYYSTLDNAIASDGFSLHSDMLAIVEAVFGAEDQWRKVDRDFLLRLSDKYPREHRSSAKPRRGFWLGLVFWLAPDFDDIEEKILAGVMEAPRFDMVKFDYRRVHNLICKWFELKRKQVFVGNDFIDQTVPHMRIAGRLKGDPNCNDFVERLLVEAKKSQSQVVNVRDAWSAIQLIKDRSFAPPPVGIPIVIRCDAFDESARVLNGMSMRLGITAGTMEAALLDVPAESQGRIGQAGREELAGLFGTPYKEFVTLGPTIHDEFPDWVTRAMNKFR